MGAPERTRSPAAPVLSVVVVMIAVVAMSVAVAGSSSNSSTEAPLSVSPTDGFSNGYGNTSAGQEGNTTETFHHSSLLFEVRPELINVNKYVSIFIQCIGFPGNLLSFVVWIQKRMRHSSGCYLAALALDDFIFLTLHVILELHIIWGLGVLNMPVVCQVFPILFLTAQYMGPLLVLGFTTERYISICHPFKRERYCTVRIAKRVIALLVGSALCLSGIQGYFYHDTTSEINSTTSNPYDCGPRKEVQEGSNASFFILWNLSIEILTFVLVPLTVLVLNILVIAEMRRLSRVEQVTLHGHHQRTSATTVMLLAVSFYLILTTMPVTIAYTLFYEFEYDPSRESTKEGVLQDPMFHRWVTYEVILAYIREFGSTQYAFNFIIYVSTGKVFRAELKRIFSKVLCGKLSLSISKEYSSLRSSFKRGDKTSSSTKTKSMWVSVNGNSTAGTSSVVTTTTTTPGTPTTTTTNTTSTTTPAVVVNTAACVSTPDKFSDTTETNV